MKISRSFLGLVLALTAAVLLRADPVPARPAPAWKLKDVDGKVISSDQFKGKVVVVDFWATWCPPCRAEIPGYIALQKKYGKDGLVIIGMSLDQDAHPAQTVKAFMQQAGMNYQVVLGDEDVETAFAGGDPIEGIPTTFLIDRAGNIRDRKVGAEPETTYEQTILKYLK